MARAEDVSHLKDLLAVRLSHIDQRQVNLDQNRGEFTEREAQEIQADIDVAMFNYELDKLKVRFLEGLD